MERRWRHTERLPFECPCISGLDSSVAVTLLRDDLFRVCSGSDHVEAVLLASLPFGRVTVIAATACVLPFLLDPTVALGRVSPWHMKLQCLDLIATFLLGVSSVGGPASPRPCLCWHAFACLPGPPAVRGYSACRSVLISPGALACA